MPLVVSTTAKGKRKAEDCDATSDDEGLFEMVSNNGLIYTSYEEVYLKWSQSLNLHIGFSI